MARVYHISGDGPVSPEHACFGQRAPGILQGRRSRESLTARYIRALYDTTLMPFV